MAGQTIRCDEVSCASVYNRSYDEPLLSQNHKLLVLSVEQSRSKGSPALGKVNWNAHIRFSAPPELNGKHLDGVALHLHTTSIDDSESTPDDSKLDFSGSYFKVMTNPMVSDWSEGNVSSILGAMYAHPLSDTLLSDFSLNKDISIALKFNGNSPGGASLLDCIFKFGVFLRAETDFILPARYDYGGFEKRRDFDFSNGIHTPYLTATVSDVTPRVATPTPTSGFIDIKKDFTFSWSFDYDRTFVYGTLTQMAAKIRWRPAGTESYTEYSAVGATSYRLRANSIGENVLAIEWQVLVQGSNTVWSEPSPWITLTTQDSSPNPMPVSPINKYLNISEQITFTWKHVIATGSTQTRFDLQYCRDGATWLAIASELTARQTYTAAAYTFPTGQIRWRVRTYNSAGIASSWSEASAISIVGAPGAPTITSVSNACRPTVRWQCADQTSYELEVLRDGDTIYATGEIVSSDKAHAIAEYLFNDIYMLRLRVRGQQEFSAWMIATFTVSVSGPNPPRVTVTAITGGAAVFAAADDTVAKLYLLRDSIPIAKFTGSFTDYSCTGTHYYSVRAIGANDSFCDTREIEVAVTLTSAVIAAASDLSHMLPLALRSGEPPKNSGGKTLVGGAQRCAGRRYPLYEFSDYTDEQYSLAFTFRNRADWRRLSELIERRETMLYRDQRGNSYYGVIAGASFDQGTDTDFTLSFTRVDYVEQIPYEPPVLT